MKELEKRMAAHRAEHRRLKSKAIELENRIARLEAMIGNAPVGPYTELPPIDSDDPVGAL